MNATYNYHLYAYDFLPSTWIMYEIPLEVASDYTWGHLVLQGGQGQVRHHKVWRFDGKSGTLPSYNVILCPMK